MINTVYKVAAIQRWICGCIQISSQLEKACPVPMKLLIDEKIKGEALMEVISIQITTSSMEGGGTSPNVWWPGSARTWTQSDLRFWKNEGSKRSKINNDQ